MHRLFVTSLNQIRRHCLIETGEIKNRQKKQIQLFIHHFFFVFFPSNDLVWSATDQFYAFVYDYVGANKHLHAYLHLQTFDSSRKEGKYLFEVMSFDSIFRYVDKLLREFCCIRERKKKWESNVKFKMTYVCQASFRRQK